MTAHGSPSASAHGGEINYINCEKGFWSWWMTIDHKRLGLMYLYSMFAIFIIAGLAALGLRLEHMYGGGSDLMKPANYNRVLTVHGVMMVFLFIVPGIPATLGNFLLPLMIGAKDVAFPRLNRLSYWLFVGGAVVGALALAMGLDTGWTFYAPYSIQNSSHVLLMATAAFIVGFSSILTGMNFLVTIHKMRCPGMTWDRLPLFVWTLYATAMLQIVATPVVGITVLMLLMENALHIGVFNPDYGGDPVLFQHMFWFYSHPVVYIMILPAFGIISEIIPVFSRKPIFGYKSLVYATMGIAAISFLVWGHHMFVAGMSNTARYVFSFITFFVAIPTAVKVFNWVATMYKGSIRIESPMLYAMGFIWIFLIAGCTGIHLATVALDAHYHDTYFVVAHFHYTMQGGTVISLFAGLHYWFPKMYGRMYNEKIARITWALIFFGFNLTFLPQFILGMEGMPRRYATYPDQFYNMHWWSSVGAFINGLGYASVIVHLAYMAIKGKKASENPWHSLSLEWQTPSPPAHDNFAVIPRVSDWTYSYGLPEGVNGQHLNGHGSNDHHAKEQTTHV